MFSIVVPCYNEEQVIGLCLASLLAQKSLSDGHGIEIIIAANGCRDRTVEIATRFRTELEHAGFTLQILDLADAGKAGALNAADHVARWPARLYLDADVVLSDRVLSALSPLLLSPEVVYCSATLECATGRDFASNAYARIWAGLPFVHAGVSGIGLYGMSARARARWDSFPDLHSDDRFARLQFSASERHKVDEIYYWPVPEGLTNLIRVRRRWNEGNRELMRHFPDLRRNDDKKSGKGQILQVLARRPVSGMVFCAVWGLAYALAALRNPHKPVPWRRGRP